MDGYVHGVFHAVFGIPGRRGVLFAGIAGIHAAARPKAPCRGGNAGIYGTGGIFRLRTGGGRADIRLEINVDGVNGDIGNGDDG